MFLCKCWVGSFDFKVQCKYFYGFFKYSATALQAFSMRHTPMTWEVSKPFILLNGIHVNWIPCHSEGYIIDEAGSWNGAIGKVTKYIIYNYTYISTYPFQGNIYSIVFYADSLKRC